jgi:hypothetical protein
MDDWATEYPYCFGGQGHWGMPLLIENSSGPNHWVGNFGPLVVLFWLREVEPSVCRKLSDIVRQVSERQRVKFTAVLSISLPGAQAPSSDARKALADLIRATDNRVSRVAVVREGQGFVSSVVSSVVIGVQMLAKPSSLHKSFTVVDEAARWATADLAEFRGGEFVVDEAIVAVERQRKALQTRYQSAS